MGHSARTSEDGRGKAGPNHLWEGEIVVAGPWRGKRKEITPPKR